MYNHNQIRRKILELLYLQSRRCASYVKIEYLLKNIDKIKHEDLWNHVQYLNNKGYVQIKQIQDGFVITKKIAITSEGIVLIENENFLNSKFPVE